MRSRTISSHFWNIRKSRWRMKMGTEKQTPACSRLYCTKRRKRRQQASTLSLDREYCMLGLFGSRLAKRAPVFRVQQQAHGRTPLLIWRLYSTGGDGHPPGGGGGMQGFPGLNFGPGKMEKGQALNEFVRFRRAHPKLFCPDIL